MSEIVMFPRLEPPASGEEWEAAWDASIRLARGYGWPERYIETILASCRVSYAERLASVERFNQLNESGQWREAMLEAKRTRLRTPANPADMPHMGRSHQADRIP